MAQKLLTINGDSIKAINPWDSDSSPEAWTWFSNAPLADQDKLYARVSAAFRAYNLKANTISSMPFVLYDKAGNEYDSSKQWENKCGFLPNPQELFRLNVLSYMATNTIYALRTSDAIGYKTKGLYHAVAYSFRPYVENNQLKWIERTVNNQLERYKPDDPRLIRMWRLDHTTELLPSPNTEAMAIMNAAGEIYFADLWIKHFYQRGGIKPTLIAMKGMIIKDKKEDEERSWTNWLRGIGQWTTRVARIFNAESMDIKPFGSGVDDLKNNDVYQQAIANIAMATGMPLSLLLSNSANYATAMEEKATWYESDLIPFCNWMQYEYNTQVWQPLGLYMEFKPETLDPQQEDETERASAINTFMDFLNKCPTAEIALESALTFGYELTDGLIAAINTYYVDKEKRAEQIQAQIQQAKPPTDTQQSPAAAPIAPEPTPPPPAKWIPSLSEYKELSVWQDVALRRHKKGESLDFEYAAHYGGLPENVIMLTREALSKAVNVDEIKSAFDIERYISTETPAPEYKNDILLLAAAMNKYTDMFDKGDYHASKKEDPKD